jgi:hypothetical protein
MEARGPEPRPSDPKPSSWTARILAPLALALVTAALVLLITGSLGSDEDGEQREREKTTSTGCQPDAEQAVEDGYYVIKSGEDLSVVADKTCIPIERLTRLNENLDPQLIQVDACVDLVREGCKVLAEGG